MKKLALLLLIFSVSGCIPLQVAPNIETDKVQLAKKFKRNLPKKYAFIFEDTKKANEFYSFINMKYNREHMDVEYNVPFTLNNKTYYMSFYEREKTTQTINFLPLAVDAALDSQEVGPIMQDHYSTRSGKWFVLLTISDDTFQDCLHPNYSNRDMLLSYLRELQKEYFRTYNYLEAYLRNN
ncbi:hypothetical protein [Hanstruepera flava]|uniref:hypothetical protein n=1 Tax=Hanstruepera flava TaxID=2930218 RepID=UPI002027974A|nr:hypothetical protein [Hanstruepera flava]